MSAPVNNGSEIKPITPIMAIMSAPKKALPKPFTSKPGTSAAASIIIKALMTRANSPKLNTDNGAVKNHSTGRINAFIKPKTAVAITKAVKFFIFIPGTINIVKPSPMAVANQTMNKVIITL